MTIDNIMPGIAAAIGVIILMSLVSQKAAIENGRTVIKYGIAMKIFSWLSLALPLMVIAIFPKVKSSDIPSVIAAFFMASGISASLILEFNRVMISYDDKFIYTKSPWRKNRKIPWSDITSIGFSSAASWYVVLTKNNGKIRLHTGLNGLKSILSEINKHIEINGLTSR